MERFAAAAAALGGVVANELGCAGSDPGDKLRLDVSDDDEGLVRACCELIVDRGRRRPGVAAEVSLSARRH